MHRPATYNHNQHTFPCLSFSLACVYTALERESEKAKVCPCIWENVSMYLLILYYSFHLGLAFLMLEVACKFYPPFPDDVPASALPTIQCCSTALSSLLHFFFLSVPLSSLIQEVEAVEESRQTMMATHTLQQSAFWWDHFREPHWQADHDSARHKEEQGAVQGIESQPKFLSPPWSYQGSHIFQA